MTAQKITVDWFRARVQAEPREALEALRPMFGTLGGALVLKSLPRGILGFRQAVSVDLVDKPVARMDFGGESQRGWVRLDMPGQGCEWVQDWEAVEGVEALPSSEIRRLDLALTTWDGEITHERVVAAHTAGRFVTSGRPPAMRQIVSTDPRAGRTCEIGARKEADKFLRAYEKGFQMAAKFAGGLPGEMTHIDGKRIEDIYRVEVEFKAENRPIPWETIEHRDQYFAGAYPFCADVLPGVKPDVLMRRKERAPQLDLQAALGHCRTQYGAVLFTAMHAFQGDITAVWDRVVGDHHSQHLLEAGVLLVDH